MAGGDGLVADLGRDPRVELGAGYAAPGEEDEGQDREEHARTARRPLNTVPGTRPNPGTPHGRPGPAVAGVRWAQAARRVSMRARGAAAWWRAGPGR